MSMLSISDLDDEFWNTVVWEITPKSAVLEKALDEDRVQQLALPVLASSTQPPVIQPQVPEVKPTATRTEECSVSTEMEPRSDVDSSTSYKPKKRKIWTEREDDLIRKGIQKFDGKKWTNIRDRYLPNLTAKQIRQRFHDVLDPDIKRGPWSKEEIESLRNGIKRYGLVGNKKWQNLANSVFKGKRTGKECHMIYTRIISKQTTK